MTDLVRKRGSHAGRGPLPGPPYSRPGRSSRIIQDQVLPQVLRRIATWLKPGGYLLLSLEAADYDDAQGTWLGVPMFLSVFPPQTTKDIVAAAGFQILESSVENQFEEDHDIPYLWILARRAEGAA
jgi:hypothetical protein